MRLGIIGWIKEEEFKRAKERGLEFIEICVNERHQAFLDGLEELHTYSRKYEMPIGSVGRWGEDKITAEGIKEEELQIEYRLIEATAKLGCAIYITGCNYVESLSYYENCTLAINYFEKLIAYGKSCGVKIATYNCRWNNFVHSDPTWTVIHGYLKDLGIKYDTSHCIYDGGDYLAEAKKWGTRFVHVHIKGALVIAGERFDDPPAGMDQTDWGSFMAVLYAKGYDGNLSIEPHSSNWYGELGQKGIDFTIKYMRNLML
ncbi:MAG: sugar phosphate isomerase/epimerase [Niameybacter sp.]